ncbi:PQQ-dependent dehydrogenase, methanol/ethanol family [Novosphingobium rosa]|uniref:PQQ-dependent dehydrogenase, methanol/ethanol family n=1 Tax=Novosphingobium rosa TaxID=76978 RepID=UPI0012EE93FB|nr:PQQ-dependent dehydrogenase, methanol/ethanol family [Novosphingobium rosa]
MSWPILGTAMAALAIAGMTPLAAHGPPVADPDARLRDSASGADWPAYGRTLGEQHFSPLSAISTGTVARLGLAWSIDLPPGNPMSAPIAVNGVLYTATGYSVVRAIDGASGRILWTYDPHAAEAAGKKLRMNWGSRGLAWWEGRLYVGTVDGRLIALEARTGKTLWSVMTVGKEDMRSITGAPRVFDGKVLIGHGGADVGPTRGYVTAYDARSGRQLWRFYTVPGNPADGFEDSAQAMAAKTWSGRWWEHGGGGTAWNTFSYDPETRSLFIGTGNGAPWNHRVRSEGKGDNLFLCSIIALDADTGRYKWHFQFNPGETWDYNAAMDMHLATLPIAGKPRKVVIEAPKNGYLYVIDRNTGAFISADRIAKVTWASAIDSVTGRPVETPGARYADGQSFELWPSPHGAHSWLPSAFSPQTGLVYVPVMNSGETFSNAGIDPQSWRHPDTGEWSPAARVVPVSGQQDSYLLAWDPLRRRQAWKVPTPAAWNGGVLATGGRLVFQGQGQGRFIAYDAASGRRLWSFDAGVPVLAPPIAYTARGKEYITVLAGVGTTAGVLGGEMAMTVDYRSQQRRILTFALGGSARLAAPVPVVSAWHDDPALLPDAQAAERGFGLFARRCVACHGMPGASGGTAPELLRSAMPGSAETFEQIVRHGALQSQGMPAFAELSTQQLTDIRQFLHAQAHRQAN